MNISSHYFILIIVIIVIIVSVICYYFFKYQYKEKVRRASWETLKRNHPDLEKLFRKYSADPKFFKHVDELMTVKTLEDFKSLVDNFVNLYPDFDTHMKSLKLSNTEIFDRFLNHRSLAKIVFDSIRS
jgi:hypothetical protein